MVDRANKQEISRINEQRILAWNTAAFIRSPKMPSLSSILLKESDLKPKKKQTPRQMLDVAMSIARKLGGTIRRVKRGAGEE